MDQAINKFIKHTIVNLEGALMKDEDQLTLAVLVNLEGVIDTYIEALEYALDNPTENWYHRGLGEKCTKKRLAVCLMYLQTTE